MTLMQRVGALDIAEAIAAHTGSYVDMNSIQFLVVEDDRVRCWYTGEGPTFGIDLTRASGGWLMALQEYPLGIEQEIEVP